MRATFLFTFTVLTCGDKAEIDHVTSTLSTEPPWFLGTIINYSCEDTDYQLKYNSTSGCKVDGTEAKWVNQSEIRCIPGMSSTHKFLSKKDYIYTFSNN